MLRRISIGLALALLLVLPAAATDLQHAFNADKRGDYATAIRIWRPLAERGNADAQFNLALTYRYGRGNPRDDGLAVKWYRKAAVQGDERAQFSLGVMYFGATGVPRDFVQAYMWVSLAAAKGYKGGAKAKNAMAQNMSRAQIAEAERRAREWRARH